jgi:SAM-dependent methyltransferase
MIRPRNLVILAGAAAATVAVVRHGRRAARGHTVAGGILIGHAGAYDTLSRLLLGPLIDGIAADVAAVAPAGAQVLEVGCGPGHLSIRLARQQGLEVTGLDLDPAMIARARANADRPGNSNQRQPAFLVGDVATLAYRPPPVHHRPGRPDRGGRGRPHRRVRHPGRAARPRRPLRRAVRPLAGRRGLTAGPIGC